MAETRDRVCKGQKRQWPQPYTQSEPQAPLPGSLPAPLWPSDSPLLSPSLLLLLPQAPQSLGCCLAPLDQAAQACGNTLQPLGDPCSHLSPI